MLDPETLHELGQHQVRQMAEARAQGAKWRPQSSDYADLVFTNETGGYIVPRNFDRDWYALQEAARDTYVEQGQSDEEKATRRKQVDEGKVLRHIRFHDLRHMHVSLLNKAGIDARTIADRIGHSDPAFTLRRYAHVFDDQRKGAAIGLHKLLNSSTSEPT